jgi:hypothetical protein
MWLGFHFVMAVRRRCKRLKQDLTNYTKKQLSADMEEERRFWDGL